MSDATYVLTASPEAIAAAAAEAIGAARAGVALVKAGGRAPLELLEAYDEAMLALGDAGARVSLIAVTNPDAATREAADTAKQDIAKVGTELSLDRGLYDALVAIDEGLANADAGTRQLLTKALRDFRRAGVDRDEATRERVRALQDQLVAVGQDFDRNIRTDTRTASLPPEALAGLPEDFVAAHPAGDDGLVKITTEYPDYIPFITYATSGAAREQLWRLYRQRGNPANIETLARMRALRHELATLLGYADWADYVAEDKMIGSADHIAEFIDRIAAASGERATADYERLLARKRVDSPEAPAVFPWDSSFLDDRVKAEQLAFDSQALRPYLEYGRVKAGLMRLVERLFGIEFVARPEVPVWHPEVECFEVTDGGEPIGRIFLDMHPRADKYNHAAEFTITTGKRDTTGTQGHRVPECALVCNLPRPGAEGPALLQHSDVETFFHEFGHLLHHILGGQGPWALTSGVATEWDFVEAPSQLLEEWVRDADALRTFAVHYRTGEPIPTELVDQLRAAEEYGKGLYVRQQMFYATLSLRLYRGDPAGVDPVEVERTAYERLTPYHFVDGAYTHLSFGHLDEYSAIYYTYMWSLVIAKDLFTVFERDGLLNPAAAARYRAAVLAPGGSAPAADLVAAFLTRPYSFDAYQAWLKR